MTTQHITAEMVQNQERDSMIDALLDGSFELNDDFITRYAGIRVAAALRRLKEADRAFVMNGCIEPDKCFFPGGVMGLSLIHI